MCVSLQILSFYVLFLLFIQNPGDNRSSIFFWMCLYAWIDMIIIIICNVLQKDEVFVPMSHGKKEEEEENIRTVQSPM